ncbi:MAG: hypothetical protein ACI8PW_000260 [Methylophilaceae bacterium]|jgi:hypothetical protein
MCPTELLYDSSNPHSLQLLPIDSRAFDATTIVYKRYPDEWTVIEFNVNSNESMEKAFEHVSQTKRVTLQEAEKYELFDPNNSDDALNIGKDGLIDIPCWRYAVINLPHPLSKA